MSLDSLHKLSVIAAATVTVCAAIAAMSRWIWHYRDAIGPWLKDVPYHLKARWLARKNIRALYKFATLRGVTADEEAMKIGYQSRKDYAREARLMHFRSIKDPTLGLDR